MIILTNIKDVVKAHDLHLNIKSMKSLLERCNSMYQSEADQYIIVNNLIALKKIRPEDFKEILLDIKTSLAKRVQANMNLLRDMGIQG